MRANILQEQLNLEIIHLSFAKQIVMFMHNLLKVKRCVFNVHFIFHLLPFRNLVRYNTNITLNGF